MLTVLWTDGGCGLYTGSVCQQAFSFPGIKGVFMKASVNVNVSDSAIERWLEQIHVDSHNDESSGCYSAARLLLCHHVYPPCDVNDLDNIGQARSRQVCRQVFSLVHLRSLDCAFT